MQMITTICSMLMRLNQETGALNAKGIAICTNYFYSMHNITRCTINILLCTQSHSVHRKLLLYTQFYSMCNTMLLFAQSMICSGSYRIVSIKLLCYQYDLRMVFTFDLHYFLLVFLSNNTLRLNFDYALLYRFSLFWFPRQRERNKVFKSVLEQDEDQGEESFAQQQSKLS